MARWMLGRLGVLIVAGSLGAGWLASPALAGWKLNSTSKASIAYNQGIAFDPGARELLLRRGQLAEQLGGVPHQLQALRDRVQHAR